VCAWVNSGSIAQIQQNYGKLMVTVDALVCLLSQPDPNFSILTDVFKTNCFHHRNPYYIQDPNYTMDHRFVSNYFIDITTGVQLSYLVSRLDGPSYDDVINLINRSLETDMSGTSAYILDATDNGGPGTYTMRMDAIYTHGELQTLEMIDTLNVTSDHVTEYPYGSVTAYTSSGKHAGLPLGYLVNTLNFDYSNGAIFNTYESFNGHCMDADNFEVWRQDNQGLISEFIYMGGSGGACHVYEPTTAGVSDDNTFFPEYAIGYSLVDAAYMGMYFMAFQNVVVGDPLCTIAWGKQTLTQNLTWSGRNLVTGAITIPMYKTLTIENDSYIELRHQGFIPCNPSLGRMNIGQSVTFQTDDWQRSLFLSYDSENARIVWADHPTFPAILYNIYRKINDGEWEYIVSTMDNEYIDEEVFLTCYECPINAVVHYFVKGVDVYEQESEASNEVSAEVIARVPKESVDNKNGMIYEYSLSQNYPNPFNPTTKIDYSIKLAGEVIIKVYDVLGNEIATLVNERKEPGNYSVEFNAGNLPSGIYVYTLTSGNFVSTKKFILLK